MALSKDQIEARRKLREIEHKNDVSKANIEKEKELIAQRNNEKMLLKDKAKKK
jgi:hypothetical protein